MNKYLLKVIAIFFGVITSSFAQNTFPGTGATGIGTTSPNASSLLEITSTSKGLLIPRMTKVQRDAIATPATGLMIFQTNSTPGFYYFNGSTWTAIKSKAGWSLTGNAGTTPTTNFVGTTDAQPLIFKVNNQPSGTLDFGSEANTSYGYQALMSNTNYNNTAIGYNTLKLSTTGGYNTAIGTYSMVNNTVGYQNTAVGSNSLQSNQSGNFNSAMGYGALLNNTTGNSNVAIGNTALLQNTTGSGNIAIGDVSLYNNTTGSENTAMGIYSIYNNTTGSGGVAYGAYALQSNTSGNNNTAIGNSSLFSNADGSHNVAIGMGAMSSNFSGSYNVGVGENVLYNSQANYLTAIGFEALKYNTTGDFNTATGAYALFSNTTGHHNTATGNGTLTFNTTGFNNTAIGTAALNSNTSGSNNTATGYSALHSNTTGGGNTAYGANALSSNTTGGANTAVGYALKDNTTGSGNTATGSGALNSNTTGSLNTAIGDESLSWNTVGNENVASGTYALYFNSSGSFNAAYGNGALQLNEAGSQNSAFGYGSLLFNIDGNYNTAFGYKALWSNVIGSWNTCVGNKSDVSLTNLNGASSFGTQAITNASNKIVIGASGIASMVIGGYKPWSNLSDGRFKEEVKENVPGLEFINLLRPVTYTINVDKLQHHITAQMPDSIARNYYPTEDAIVTAKKNIQTGFIAQEVETVAKEIGYQFDVVNAPQNSTDNYSIAYSQFVPSLVKSVQELSQQNEALKSALAELQKQLNALIGNQKPSSQNTSTSIINIAPNPATDVIKISISESDRCAAFTLKVIDVSGKLVGAYNVTCNSVLNLNIASYSSGTYLLQLFNQNELVESQKLIVQ